MEIPKSAIPEIFNISIAVYNKTIRVKDGVALISEQGIAKSSASDYVYGLKALLNGKRFTRTLNTESMDFFMKKIHGDYGSSTLSKALNSLSLHIEYYEGVQKAIMWNMREILAKYSLMIPKVSLDDIEQNEIIREIESLSNREHILNDLRNLKETDPEVVVINHISYKRDNKTIAQIKYIRDYKCQICDVKILKSNGSYYIEAAHIYPKHKMGRETPDNIILLCPNHHKEFDLGATKIISRSADNVHFKMNGTIYNVSLAIE